MSRYHAIRARLAPADYRGEHQPPTRADAASGSGSPLHDLSGTYPDDFYGPDGARLYGGGETGSGEAWSVIRSVRGRPNARVKVYRAVPRSMGRDERIRDVERRKRDVLRRGRVPADARGDFPDASAYYEHLCGELERLEAMPEEEPAKSSIEPGNWVTVSRLYAKEHGEAALNGEYRILSKTVRAADIFTDGNSLVEQGYDPA